MRVSIMQHLLIPGSLAAALVLTPPAALAQYDWGSWHGSGQTLQNTSPHYGTVGLTVAATASPSHLSHPLILA